MSLPTTQSTWKWVICLLLLFGLGHHEGIAIADNGVAGSPNANRYSLDLANRTVTKTINQEVTAPQVMKFVQIEVAEVINPLKIPLSFRVDYQPAHGERSQLGTFSLFPPDNPGTFIVATRGKLRRGGMIIVSLVPLEHVDEKAEIRVRLKRISFIEH